MSTLPYIVQPWERAVFLVTAYFPCWALFLSHYASASECEAKDNNVANRWVKARGQSAVPHSAEGAKRTRTLPGAPPRGGKVFLGESCRVSMMEGGESGSGVRKLTWEM